MLDSPPKLETLPTFEDMMAHRRAFYRHRRADSADTAVPTSIPDKQAWDSDLTLMSDATLQHELKRLQAAVRQHRELGDRE